MRLDEHNRILIQYSELIPIVFGEEWYRSAKRRDKVDVVGRGCRGNGVAIVYDTLSDYYKGKICAVLGDPRKILGLIPANPAGKPERIAFAELTPAQLQVCRARYNLVKAFRDYATTHGAELGTVGAKKEFVRIYEDGYLNHEEHNVLQGVSFQTLERWNKELREGGEVLDALAPAKRDRNSGTSLTPDQQQRLIKLYLNPNKPTITDIYRMARRVWRTSGETDIPSLTSARRFMNGWIANHNDIVTFHREGEKALKETCLPHIERDPSKIKYLDVLVSDGKVMNFQVVHPDTGRLCRPTMVAWIDARTLTILGFELTPTENTLSVVSSFRMACLNAGRLMGVDGAIVPRSIYVDNGRAFKNKALGNGKQSAALSSETAGLFERLKPYGLQHVQYAKAYNGRTKVIERIWQFFDEVEKLAATYVGGSIENKPASLMRNETYHKNSRARKLAEQGVPTLWGAYDLITGFIGQYNNRAGDGKYLAGYTPMELAAKETKAIDFTGRTIAPSELNYMIMHSRTARLTANGVKVNGISYYNPAFIAAAGTRLDCVVRYDLRDRERVWVFREDGTFWCEATAYFGANVHPMAALGSDVDVAQYRAAVGQQSALTNATINRAIAVKEHGNVLSLPIPSMAVPDPLRLPVATEPEPAYRMF